VASRKAPLTHGNSTTRLGDDVDELALMMVESMISVSRANAWAGDVNTVSLQNS